MGTKPQLLGQRHFDNLSTERFPVPVIFRLSTARSDNVPKHRTYGLSVFELEHNESATPRPLLCLHHSIQEPTSVSHGRPERTSRISCTTPARCIAEKPLSSSVPPCYSMHRPKKKGGRLQRSHEWSPLVGPPFPTSPLSSNLWDAMAMKKTINRQRKRNAEKSVELRRSEEWKGSRRDEGRARKRRNGYCKNLYWHWRRKETFIWIKSIRLFHSSID